MTPGRWQQVKGLLAEVLEADPCQRSAHLDQVCAEDRSLRLEVESLLAAEQGPVARLLHPPAVVNGPDGCPPSTNARIGRRIGDYQIVEEIGIGGMGEVYRAFRADDQYRKEVALKLVRAGQDSKFVVARFKNERQVLANLDHSNIARLLDGGTTEEGVPFLVMDLIAGQPITEYCDAARLPTTERLRLFLKVCSAVQYAHQRLIVHRDLKPSNILVTAEGIPKLLDFGIAKILDPSSADSSEPTISMFRLLTPGYASPEQIKGEANTTASDVYSLGVLLYELLTGHRPYRISGHAPHEIERAVCEFEPEPPSAVLWRNETQETSDGSSLITPLSVSAVRDGSPEKLRKSLRGDLDNIVLTALRKEPERRYTSPEQLAADIQRHLENLPVTASKDTFRYRSSKFVRRHKAGVAAAVIVVLTVFSGLAATLYEAHVARQQEFRAEQRFNDVRELANSLMFEVHDSIQDLPGSTPARKFVVERALRYLDSLSRDAVSDVSLQKELATAYEKVGTVQGNPFGANLGDIRGALQSYHKSLAIRELLGKTKSGNVDDQVALARIQRLFAATSANLPEAGDEQATLSRELAALATAEKAFKLAPSNPDVLQELQANYDLLFTLRHYAGDYEGAWEYLEKEQPIIEQRLRATPDDLSIQLALGKAEVKSGQELAKLGFRTDAALGHFRRGIQIFKFLSAHGTDANAGRYLAVAQDRFGDALLMDANVTGALQSYRKEVQILEPLLMRDPTNAVVQLDLGSALAKVGDAMALKGELKTGLATLNRAAAMFRTQIKRDPSYTEPRWSLAWSLLWMGDVLGRSGSPALAMEKYREALEMWEKNDSSFIQAIVAGIHVRMGAMFARMGKPSQASQEYQQALVAEQRIIELAPYMLDARYLLADACSGLGELKMSGSHHSRSLRVQTQQWTEARSWYQRSLEAWSRIQNPGSRTPVGFECGNPKQVAQHLARCNTALRGIQAGESAGRQ